MDIEDYLAIPPYSLGRESKRARLAETLGALTHHHYLACPAYRRILDAMRFEPTSAPSHEDLPFLPVRLFKEYDLLSVDRADVVKTMTSSGTSGQQVSRIFLDKTTAAQQTKALSRIVASYLGSKRLPMLILDTAAVVKDRATFSARGAGILASPCSPLTVSMRSTTTCALIARASRPSWTSMQARTSSSSASRRSSGSTS